MSERTFVETSIRPTRIVWQPGDIEVPQDQDYLLRGASATGLVFDFGVEFFGELQVSVGGIVGAESATLDVRFGESMAEVLGSAYIEKRIKIRPDSVVRLGKTGFRFVRLETLDEGVTVELDRVMGVSTQRPLEYLGAFNSSDERLNRIWQVGAYTVQLCMQSRVWDGIKRGRSVWIGDLYPEAMVASVVFGEQPVFAESLDEIRDTTVAVDPEELGWMNGISGYSLWWLLTHHQWYLYHGNRDYLEDQRTYLRRLIPKLLRAIDSDGREQLDGWRFVDWAIERPHDHRAAHAGYQGLFAWALQAAGSLCEILEEPKLQQDCLAGGQQLARHIPPNETNKQAAALLVLGGLVDPQEVNRDLLSKSPCEGLTPFLTYPVLEARSLAGDISGCLELSRDYWGAMLDLGATTYWEDFDISWVTNTARIDRIAEEDEREIPIGFGRCQPGVALSLCHGWSCGVTAWLTNHVLGVRPSQPGSSVIEVRPSLADLEWVEGSFPTPHGVVRLRHTRTRDGRVTTDIDAPAGVEVSHVTGTQSE